MKLPTFSLMLLFVVLFKPAHGQTTRIEKMENAVHRYLDKNFETKFLFFTYVGNVEVRSVTQNRDGTYYVTGRFDYNNLADFRVKRSFRASLRTLLDVFIVSKFEFYYFEDDPDKWIWKEI